MARKSGKGSGAGKVFMGFLLGVAGAAGAGYAWLHYGENPSALRGKLPSMPAGLTGESSGPDHSGDPSKTAVESAKKTPPFGTSEDVFEGGAHVYRARCASCHGTPGHDATLGGHSLPASPQLWKKGKGGAIGVSAKDPGDIYTQIAHGRHKAGMAPFATTLPDTQIWQVTLLLKNAGTELPDPVINILEGK
ncbi:MAG: cytochrome c [Acidobacteria bacterium]|nr:cytochrome c [Acidobacteriota bacterium]